MLTRALPLILIILLCFFVGILFTTSVATTQENNTRVNTAVVMAKRPAPMLSAYNLFADPRRQIPNHGVIPYDLIAPLFSDYAHKYRFAYLPEGQSAAWQDGESLAFPVGTVLVKTFAYPADFRNPQDAILLIETRLLIHQENGWVAWAYVWDDAMIDATLKVAGAAIPVRWIDESGAAQTIRYLVPNRNQCKGCHMLNKNIEPIGTKARNMNRMVTYDSEPVNQLEAWQRRGMMTGLANLATLPTMAAIDDPDAGLNDKARAYLDVNCAHCHRLEGPASTSGLFLRWEEQARVALGFGKPPVAAGRGSGGLLYDIVPGEPQNSILYYRMTSTDPGVMMPELGRTINHREGLNLIEAWISAMQK